MHLPFSSRERAALRLAAVLAGAPDDVTFARDAVLRAVHDVFEIADDEPIAPVHAPVRGRDILIFTGH